ncbi:PAS domain-containing sensor histidine kinase, partial [candidate division KSB3 bacterium]
KKHIQSDEPGRIARIRKRRRQIQYGVLAFCLMLIPGFLFIQYQLFEGEFTTNFDNNILIFGLININIILVLIVLFLILRTLAEFLFESRARRLGNRLKTKMIASFLSLTLIPTLLLFIVSLKFVSTSMDYWFNTSVEQSLKQSLELAQTILSGKKNQAAELNRLIADHIQQKQLQTRQDIDDYLTLVMRYSSVTALDALRFYSRDNAIRLTKSSGRQPGFSLPEIPPATFTRLEQKEGKRDFLVQDMPQGTLVTCLEEIEMVSGEKALLAASLLIDSEEMQHMRAISSGVENYRQLKHFKEPFKFLLVIILLIVTLLVAFAAIWFALYISRGLTAPLENLALATRRIAEGDLEFQMESDSAD